MMKWMRLPFTVFACAAFVAAHAVAATQPNKSSTDTCALLEGKEIARVQGEPVTDTKASRTPNPEFTMAQCVYTLGTSSKGVSLTVAEPSVEKPEGARTFWQQRFQEERERSKRARAAAGREGEKAEPVSGVGDEAFWVGDPRVGSLYVLVGRRFFRISVGGVQDPGQRRERSLELARAVMRRMSTS